MFVQIAQNDFLKMGETIELPNGTKLSVMTEGRTPACSHCGKKGHLKKTCTQYMQETEEVQDIKDIEITTQGTN